MKKLQYALVLAAVAGCMAGMPRAGAQKVNKTTPAGSGRVPVTLGRSSYSGGPISKRVFDSLARQPLRLQGGAGVITGFNFGYSEMNLYEDSVGNLIRVRDLMEEHCPGDTLTPVIRYSIDTRTKPGDTAYYEQIVIQLPDGSKLNGQPMKFFITK